MQTVIPSLEGVGYYDFRPTERYTNQEINLVLVPVAYYTTTAGKQQILQIIINPRGSSYQGIRRYCYGPPTRSQRSG